MPRFVFAVRCRSVTEEIGQLELTDLAAACLEALRVARSFHSIMSQESMDPTLCAVEISDPGLGVIHVVPFSSGTWLA
jgi:hypothetical protein